MATNGSEIRRRRQMLGVKLGPFSERVGCSVKHMNNLENGNKQASPELLHRIAQALEVDVAAITTDEVPPAHGEQVPA